MTYNDILWCTLIIQTDREEHLYLCNPSLLLIHDHFCILSFPPTFLIGTPYLNPSYHLHPYVHSKGHCVHSSLILIHTLKLCNYEYMIIRLSVYIIDIAMCPLHMHKYKKE